jgi:probable rRNA maturation factor
MPGYDVSLELSLDAPELDVASLQLLAERVMAGEDVSDGTALAILITGDDEVREMNHRFLGIDEPTDVLSFPDEADDFVQGMADEPLLGDIAIALPTAERQAAAVGHPIDAELAHLLVHGILHLCGYDHVEGGEQEANMRAREEHYLGALGHVHQH